MNDLRIRAVCLAAPSRVAPCRAGVRPLPAREWRGQDAVTVSRIGTPSGLVHSLIEAIE